MLGPCNVGKQQQSAGVEDAEGTKPPFLRARGSEAVGLGRKQALFVREYLIDLNATQAAIRAGYSPKTARQVGYENLTKPYIQSAIQGEMDARAEKLQITSERVLRELAQIAFANMLDYITVQGDGTAYVDLSKLTREQAAAIQEIVTEEYTEGRGDGARDVRRVKFKLAEKRAALELLARHLKLLGEGPTGGMAPPGKITVVFVDPQEKRQAQGNSGSSFGGSSNAAGNALPGGGAASGNAPGAGRVSREITIPVRAKPQAGV